MKPNLLLTGQWGWSATSPLVYTLQRNAKYAHFGYTKSFRSLRRYFLPEKNYIYNYNFYLNSRGIDKETLRIYKRVADGTWENHNSYKPGTHYMNLTQDLEPLRDFPLKYATNLVTGIPTITKYMDFYHALYDHVVQRGYKSVGDGGSSVTLKQSPYLDRFYKTLTNEFSVKQILIARDPVRRAFGDHVAKLLRSKDRIEDTFKYVNYMPKIKEAIRVLGSDNVHVTVMEELWEDDGTSKQQLSNFLDHPIPELWKNLYAPDRGHLVEYDPDVPCQAYGQDQEELTEDMYYSYKEKFQHVYDAWEDYFGSLPLYWGQHLDYNTGRPL
jgi:hypothetical protein